MKKYAFPWFAILCFAFLPVFADAGEVMSEQVKAASSEGSVAVSEEGESQVAAGSVPEQKAPAAADEAAPAAATEPEDKEYGGTDEGKGIVDPFEPLNRAIFNINDKIYFYVAKPAAKAYTFFVPEWGRIRVRNVFHNAATPVRFVNSLLQFKFHAAAKEVGRFIVNTTAGLGGMFDILKDNPDAQPSEEDLGQTLGSYGLPNGFYLVLPVLGPSTFRDSIGMAGDWFLDPVTYITPMFPDRVAVRAGYLVNETSLRIGEYEDLKESAIDPYICFRDAYLQYRNKKVKEE